MVSSAPRPVIEWFAAGSRPFFALFGFFRRLAVAGSGPDKTPAYVEVARRLLHIHWRVAPCVRRLVRWAENTAAGKDARRHTLVKAGFVEGGTVGPVPTGVGKA